MERLPDDLFNFEDKELKRILDEIMVELKDEDQPKKVQASLKRDHRRRHLQVLLPSSQMVKDSNYLSAHGN